MQKSDIPVSGCIIVQDEEKYIEKAIKNIMPYVGELVIIDGGSKDKTVEIAQGLGCRVCHRTFDFNFAAQRNWATEQCHKDWILWCDADEWFSEEFLTLLPATVIKPPENCNGYQVFRISRFDGSVVGEDHQWRLLRKGFSHWVGKIHEGVQFTKGFGAKLPKEFPMYHEHTMDRQRYNNALYKNINDGKFIRPEHCEGSEYHDGKWISVKTDRDK